MKKMLNMVMLVAILTMTLVGCADNTPELVETYANGDTWEYIYGDTVMGSTYGATSVETYSDDTYAMKYTEVIDMGGMAAGTTVITAYGSYVKGETKDGFIDLILEAPTHLIYDSYSTLGGYAFDYDTNIDTEFIIPGGDDVAMDKDTFLSRLDYTESKTLYIALDSNNNETTRLAKSRE